MTAEKLCAQCLSDPEHTQLAVCSTDGAFVGHAFAATSWSYGEGIVCWTTQLVVNEVHRRKGIATMPLRLPWNCGVYDAFGLASSHPAACIALSKLGRRLPLDRRHRPQVHPCASGRGSTHLSSRLFERRITRGDCLRFRMPFKRFRLLLQKFFVEHREPLEALSGFQTEYGGIWPLGQLPEGHEFLILVQEPKQILLVASEV
ncbi:hypothetical protein DFH09DRAFT_1113881 [Mycena vulgaris]|nr:hypothetical protein DFH09DRAFT_1113881 [Mycena vulgaris]